jgi:hypothetical protein
MTGLSRRGLMKGGAGALAVAAVTPGSLRAAQGDATALFVYDARLPLSQTAAQEREAAGAALLDPRVSDLGVAWRSRIPQAMAQGGGVEGLTLWSDCLISQIFARENGVHFTLSEVPHDTGLPLYHWRAG